MILVALVLVPILAGLAIYALPRGAATAKPRITQTSTSSVESDSEIDACSGARDAAPKKPAKNCTQGLLSPPRPSQPIRIENGISTATGPDISQAGACVCGGS